MKTSMGEYVVGAYLKICLGCDVVSYNTRPPEEGLDGLAELDVIGLSFYEHTAYLCEVTTHLRGLLYGRGNPDTVRRILEKHERQKRYARKYLGDFTTIRYMFWSPVVPKGYLTENLEKVERLELVINEQYRANVEELRQLAGNTSRDMGNPFFRALQILGHLRD